MYGMQFCVCVCSARGDTFWCAMTVMGESILGVAVGTGAGRLDLLIATCHLWHFSSFKCYNCNSKPFIIWISPTYHFHNFYSHPWHLQKLLLNFCSVKLPSYFCIVSVSLFVADLILFWASRCVNPSVLTPSMAVMMSPWARLPPAALLAGVIWRRRRNDQITLGPENKDLWKSV